MMDDELFAEFQACFGVYVRLGTEDARISDTRREAMELVLELPGTQIQLLEVQDFAVIISPAAEVRMSEAIAAVLQESLPVACTEGDDDLTVKIREKDQVLKTILDDLYANGCPPMETPELRLQELFKSLITTPEGREFYSKTALLLDRAKRTPGIGPFILGYKPESTDAPPEETDGAHDDDFESEITFGGVE